MYARWVLVKIGNVVIRECDGDIGIRLLNENKPRKSATHPVFGGKTTWEFAPPIGPIVIADEGGTANPVTGDAATASEYRKMGVTLHTHVQKDVPTEPVETKQIVMGPKIGNAFTENDQKGPVKERKSSTIQCSAAMVCFEEPVETDPETSSDQEEHMGRIWGGRGAGRRLAIDTISPDCPGQGKRTDFKGRRKKEYSFDDGEPQKRKDRANRQREVRHQIVVVRQLMTCRGVRNQNTTSIMCGEMVAI